MSARETEDREVLDEPTPFLRRFKRKEIALRRLTEDSDSRDERNAAEAYVEVSDELGLYEDEREPLGTRWTPDRQENFIARTRLAGIHAQRNTSDILKIVERIEERQKELVRGLQIALFLLILLAGSLLFAGCSGQLPWVDYQVDWFEPDPPEPYQYEPPKEPEQGNEQPDASE